LTETRILNTVETAERRFAAGANVNELTAGGSGKASKIVAGWSEQTSCPLDDR